VATALMATGQAFDVDRRSLSLLLGRCDLGRCFLAVASWPLRSCPKRDATPWGINSAGRARVESGLAQEDLPVKTKTFPQQVARISLKRVHAREAAPKGMALAPDVIPAAGTSTVGRPRDAWGCVLSAEERQLHGLQN
jgi:hypothetical protein